MRLFFLSVGTLSFEGFEVKGAREMADFGEMVLLHCVCTLDDGTVAIDTKAAGEPLRVRIGSSALPSAVEMAAANLLPGGTAQVSLDPDQAFGVYDESLVFRVPRNALPHADDLSVGGRVLVETPAGTAEASSSIATTGSRGDPPATISSSSRWSTIRPSIASCIRRDVHAVATSSRRRSADGLPLGRAKEGIGQCAMRRHATLGAGNADRGASSRLRAPLADIAPRSRAKNS